MYSLPIKLGSAFLLCLLFLEHKVKFCAYYFLARLTLVLIGALWVEYSQVRLVYLNPFFPKLGWKGLNKVLMIHIWSQLKYRKDRFGLIFHLLWSCSVQVTKRKQKTLLGDARMINSGYFSNSTGFANSSSAIYQFLKNNFGSYFSVRTDKYWKYGILTNKYATSL